MRRKILMGVLALTVPLGTVLATQTGALATKPPPFTGPLVGSVTCTGINLKVSFIPPLQLTTGGSTINIKGKLSGCNVSGPGTTGESIKKAAVTGTLAGTGNGCLGLATGTVSPVSLTITWSGTGPGGGKASPNPTSSVTVNGADAATNGSGDVGFALPAASTLPAGGSVTGSFPGTVSTQNSHAYGALTTAAFTPLCSKGKGVKLLKLVSGSITLP